MTKIKEVITEIIEKIEEMKVGNHPSLNNYSAIRYNTLENVIELLKKSLSTFTDETQQIK